jgi:hypothetical protein
MSMIFVAVSVFFLLIDVGQGVTSSKRLHRTGDFISRSLCNADVPTYAKLGLALQTVLFLFTLHKCYPQSFVHRCIKLTVYLRKSATKHVDLINTLLRFPEDDDGFIVFQAFQLNDYSKDV